MSNPRNITSYLGKFIASLMTVGFSLVAFAYGQSCTLLPGRSPNTLADGASRTGYQVAGATYTQSCAQAAGQITCISGSIANGNIFKYASCTPHTWANCTTPTGANHLEYRTLYQANHNSYTKSCEQLSQRLQCLNGVFTGGVAPRLYDFASCTDQSWKQCIDTWTNSFKDHGEMLVAYAGSYPSFGQTCSTLQRTLTCTNGVRSGGNQNTLYTGCTNPPAFSGCLNTRTNSGVIHNGAINAYTHATSIGTGTCSDVLRPLTCVNGRRSGNGTQGQAGLYSGCVQANTASCPNIITNNGTLLHGSFITKYTQQLAYETQGQYCSTFARSLKCINGIRSGSASAQYTGCQDVASGSCARFGTYISHLQFVYGYSSSQPTASFGCDSVKQKLTCQFGHRYNNNGAIVSENSFEESCGGCLLPRGSGLILAEGASTGAYSTPVAEYPKTCDQNYATQLSCVNGMLNGNRQTYNYAGCQNSGGLVDGIDLAIDESPGLLGQENINGALIAQGSTPQISIVLKNKGNENVNKQDIGLGFLTCVRYMKGIDIYTSNPITSLVVNSGTKLGINIRIKSIFTQALGSKSITCSIHPSIISITDANANNNNWVGSFEIVEAKRFDLALSKSISSISKNLEAAEGAAGTQGLQNFVYNKIMNVLVPLIIVIGIMIAMFGFYKLMFSSDEKAVSEGTRYIIFGVVGIIFIMSAKFIGQNVFDLLSTNDIKGFSIASGLYNNILYPFIKFAIYLVLGAMFVILVSRVITFLFGTDADATKKAGTLIGWNVISMIIIIGAKQIVEAIYGKQADVVKDITNLGEVGSGILADKNIPILYSVINYALGIASLVILVIIIIQTIKLLMKPDDPAQIKNIKNSLMYMFIGILVLGAGYLIVNFAIIN